MIAAPWQWDGQTARKEDMDTTKRIEVLLTEEEMEFVKWLAHRDQIPVNMELHCIFNIGLHNLMNLYQDEKDGDR